MGCKATVIMFNEEGRTLDTAEIFLPEFLDWMPVELKVEWFRFMGAGHPDTKHVLFKSQGEQQLVEITSPLAKYDYRVHQEKLNGSEKHCEEFAHQHGIVRTPRNQ